MKARAVITAHSSKNSTLPTLAASEQASRLSESPTRKGIRHT